MPKEATARARRWTKDDLPGLIECHKAAYRFSFPLEAKLGEAEADVEAAVISGVDISSLNQQRQVPSVMPLADRRTDLCGLSARFKIEVVQAE